MVPQTNMINMLILIEEELFTMEGSLYTKKERVWFFVFLIRIIELYEYQIDKQKCYDYFFFLLKNQEILDILYNTEEVSLIEIEKSKFIIKLFKYCRVSIANAQIDQLLNNLIVL